MPTIPASLPAIPQSPVVLWVAGRAAALRRQAWRWSDRAPRRRRDRGCRAARTRSGRAGVPVVSGLARGCDAAAHRGALAAGGVTIAVLGCGADIVYPAEHRGRCPGGCATPVRWSRELPPGAPPLPAHFPQRNRIISGLARGVVVVEASEKSGSLITASLCARAGPRRMAVPGSILGSRHRGCHALLRDGARLVETAADVLEELGMPMLAPSVKGRPAWLADHDALLALISDRRRGHTRCARRTLRASRCRTAPRLLALELAGRVRRAPGAGSCVLRVVVRLGAPYGKTARNRRVSGEGEDSVPFSGDRYHVVASVGHIRDLPAPRARRQRKSRTSTGAAWRWT